MEQSLGRNTIYKEDYANRAMSSKYADLPVYEAKQDTILL